MSQRGSGSYDEEILSTDLIFYVVLQSPLSLVSIHEKCRFFDFGKFPYPELVSLGLEYGSLELRVTLKKGGVALRSNKDVTIRYTHLERLLFSW